MSISRNEFDFNDLNFVNMAPTVLLKIIFYFLVLDSNMENYSCRQSGMGISSFKDKFEFLRLESG